MTLLLGCLKPQSGDSINSCLRCGQMMVTTWTSKWCSMGPKYVPDERPLQINPWASAPLFFRFLMGEEYLWDTRVPVVTTLLVETTQSLPVIWLCKRKNSSYLVNFKCFFVSICLTIKEKSTEARHKILIQIISLPFLSQLNCSIKLE